MADIDFCLKQVNFKLRETPLFYISNDPERALGLEKLLENYFIICLDDSDIFTYLHLNFKNIFSYEHSTHDLNSLFRSSAKLLDEPEVNEYINKIAPKEKYFQTFKITSAFEERLVRYNAQSMNTSSDLNQEFENKIPQYKVFSKNGVKFPETIIGTLSEFNYKKLSKKLSSKFVIQFNRGHTGSGTKIIENKDQYEKLKELFPQRPARISKFIEGIPYTVNGCAAGNGIFAGGLSFQITGVRELAPSRGATVGNDFGYRKGINDKVLQEIFTEMEKIGLIMQKKGFKGMFGIDLIINNEGIYVIEINARQPASIPFYTKLQLKDNEVPLSLLHLMEFLNQVNNLDPKEYSMKNLEPINAGQLFLRNILDKPFYIKNRIKTGIYKQEDDTKQELPFKFIKEGYSIEDITDNGFVLLTQLNGKRINPGNEIARIQAMEDLTDSSGRPKNWAVKTLTAVKKFS